jgi:hypothetical protein
MDQLVRALLDARWADAHDLIARAEPVDLSLALYAVLRQRKLH